MEKSIQVGFQSDPELLSVVRSAVQQWAVLGGFDEPESRSITLAVDEAITNIIRHAYGGRSDQPIELTCCRRDDHVEFVLVDSGEPVDMSRLRSRQLEEVRPGGLGSHFITEIMDEVHYERVEGRTRLRLVKFRGK